MSNFSPLHFAASAVLLVALGGCNMDKLDIADAVVPPAAAASSATLDMAPAGQEIHRMFDNEKRGAAAVELPAQF